MSRALFIGGFSNSQRSVESVGEALDNHYSDVRAMTFPYAMENPDEVAREAKKSTVITHSAGMMAIYGCAPSQLHALGAPLPSTRLGLIWRTAAKSAQMFLSRKPDILPSFSDAVKFNASSIAELTLNGIGRFRHLINGSISSFNAITLGSLLHEMHQTDVRLVYGEHDLLFRMNHEQDDQAINNKITTVCFPGLIHDQIMLNPKATLQYYFDNLYDLPPNNANSLPAII